LIHDLRALITYDLFKVPNKYNPSRSISPSVSQKKPKERLSPSPSVSTTRRRQVDSDDVPSFARPTSASATKKREHPVTVKTNKKVTKRQKLSGK
jgi:hypothetical protein